MFDGEAEVKKEELLEKIVTAHRQLERYIFYFTKDEAGEFSASEKPKFGREKMLEPGVYGEWSLKDLLAYVCRWERLTAAMLRRKHDEIPRYIPEPNSTWGEILKADQVPKDIQKLELESVLEEFPHSFQEFYGKVVACSKEELFKAGVYTWSSAYTAGDYVKVLTVDLYDWTKGLVRKWKKRRAGGSLNKQVILERIATERRRLEGNLVAISHKDMLISGVVGTWSVKDLLAHLVEWERMFMRWYEAGLHGNRPDIPAPGYSWSEMDALNEHIFQKNKAHPLDEVLADFEDSYRQVYKLVEGIPEEDMFAVGSYDWVGNGNLVNYILANTANHYRWAKEKVRAWLKAKGEI